MANMTRARFGTFMEKLLTETMVSAQKDMGAPEYGEVYMNKMADGHEMRIGHYSDFGRMPELGEGQRIGMDSGAEGYIYNHRIKKYGLGFGISQEMIDDNRYGIMGETFAKKLRRSARETNEIDAMMLFNLAYSTEKAFLAPDGQPLISASHDSPNGNFSNMLPEAAEFNETTYEQMRTGVALMKDDKGKEGYLDPVKLLIKLGEEYEVDRILKTDLRPHTTENTINAAKARYGVIRICVNRKLVHPGRVFMITNEENGFIRWNRKKLTPKTYWDFYTDVFVYKLTGRWKFANGSVRAVYGNGPY